MSFSFSSLVRLLVSLAVCSSILAIGLSRLDPIKPGNRTIAHTKYININKHYAGSVDLPPQWLDTETGQISAHASGDGDILEAACCSPWVDGKGHRQVIGRWSARTPEGANTVSRDFGLARYEFPSGKVLDHVSTEIVPVAPPCWYPGSQAQILFVAGDGMLYRYAFEPDVNPKGLDSTETRDRTPRPLGWRCRKPGSGDFFITDLSLPEDPRMAGYLVVSLRELQSTPDGSPYFTETQLWRLKLNVAGTEVVQAGRFLEIEGDTAREKADLRSPTVGTLNDGRLVLAYLRQAPGENGWTLRVAPIELEGDQHVPQANASRSLRIATNCLPTFASFSSDGRWLNVIVDPEVNGGRAHRLPTARFFKS